MRRFAFTALIALAACSPHRIDVKLVHARTLVPEDSFGRVTLRIEDAETGEVVHEGSVEGEALASARHLFDADDLSVGHAYLAVLVADAALVCAHGRAVGRSVPFEHEEGDYEVTIQVGCADGFTPTVQDPAVPRMAHRLVATSEGAAVLAGGATTLHLDATSDGDMPFGFDGLTETTERYDAKTGGFTAAGSLVTPRIIPAVVALPGGDVGVIGGVRATLPWCETSIELVAGASSATAGGLARRRCFPSAAYLPGAERVVVIGGQQVDMSNALDRGLDAEVYDATLRTRLADRVEGEAYRTSPEVVPLADGESALVVGGVSFLTSPVASIVRAGSACAGAACIDPVPMEEPPADGFTNAAATYVPCEGGGGAVYVLGGESGPMDTRVARDEVWCYRDVPGAIGELVRAGRLPAKRSQGVAVTVGGPSGPRILLVGGTPDDSMPPGELPYDDALLVPADGCACGSIDPAAIESVPLPLDGALIMHDAAVLADGTALVVGGVRIESRVIGATGESILFVPDVAP